MAGYCTLVLYFHSPAAHGTQLHTRAICSHIFMLPSHPSNNIYLFRYFGGWSSGGAPVSIVNRLWVSVPLNSRPLNLYRPCA